MKPSNRRMSRLRSVSGLLVVLIGLATLVSSCSEDPTLEEWEAGWRTVSEGLPALTEVQVDDPRETCSATLGELRLAAAELATAPNQDLEAAFTEWVDYAESVFFECPPPRGPHPGFAASYEEMARLATEVDALLSFEHGLTGS